MKRPGQIHQKLKQAKFRHTKKELTNLLAQSYRNCKFGVQGVCKRDDLPCSNAEDRGMTCGSFTPKHTKESVQASLRNFFETSPISDISIRYPDVAALMWVLEDDSEDPLTESEMKKLLGFDLLEAELKEAESRLSSLKDLSETFNLLKKEKEALEQAYEEAKITIANQRQELSDSNAAFIKAEMHIDSLTEEIVNSKIEIHTLQDEVTFLSQKQKVPLQPITQPSWWATVKAWLS